MSKKIHLVIIDPQNSFCDSKGAMFVPGATEDMQRVAKMIDNHGDKIDDIQVTLDSHQIVDQSHPIWWVDNEGNHPNPFTIINVDDVEGTQAKWKTYNPAYQKRSVEYVKQLAANGRYPLCIWPPHCLIASWGYSILPVLSDALNNYCEKQFADIKFVTKGSNPFTEHYSAVKADVPDPADPTTEVNSQFITQLQEADEILICGEALSHCQASTLRDIIDEFGQEHAKKFVILEDAGSNVPGFEHLGEQFIKDMKAIGVRISTTDKFFK